MSHKRRHNDGRDENMQNINIPDLDLSNVDINTLLENVDKEKLNSLIKVFAASKKQKGREIEVLTALKEFLPEQRRAIVDKFIAVLSGENILQ